MCVMGAVPVPLDVEGVAGEDEAVDIVVVADVMVQMKLLPLAATMYHALFCLRSYTKVYIVFDIVFDIAFDIVMQHV